MARVTPTLRDIIRGPNQVTWPWWNRLPSSDTRESTEYREQMAAGLRVLRGYPISMRKLSE